VRRSPSVFRAIRSHLADYFELLLTSAGVLVAIALTYSELGRRQQGLAVVFLVWLQGVLVWAVHRHNWFQRRVLLRRLRLMLQDRVNTQLTVLVGAAELTQGQGRPLEGDMEVAISAARTVALELEHLSPESLRSWERQYGRFLSSMLG
jgi:hypothetical protein